MLLDRFNNNLATLGYAMRLQIRIAVSKLVWLDVAVCSRRDLVGWKGHNFDFVVRAIECGR